jgi:hypothetical protein
MGGGRRKVTGSLVEGNEMSMFGSLARQDMESSVSEMYSRSCKRKWYLTLLSMKDSVSTIVSARIPGRSRPVGMVIYP